jgi:cell division protein FtsW (lipid II flippase)
MRATMSYTALRLAIFAAALGLLYLAGARGVLLIAIAAVVSAAISFVVLARQREAMAGSISRRVTNFRERIDEGAKAEDVD